MIVKEVLGNNMSNSNIIITEREWNKLNKLELVSKNIHSMEIELIPALGKFHGIPNGYIEPSRLHDFISCREILSSVGIPKDFYYENSDKSIAFENMVEAFKFAVRSIKYDIIHIYNKIAFKVPNIKCDGYYYIVVSDDGQNMEFTCFDRLGDDATYSGDSWVFKLVLESRHLTIDSHDEFDECTLVINLDANIIKDIRNINSALTRGDAKALSSMIKKARVSADEQEYRDSIAYDTWSFHNYLDSFDMVYLPVERLNIAKESIKSYAKQIVFDYVATAYCVVGLQKKHKHNGKTSNTRIINAAIADNFIHVDKKGNVWRITDDGIDALLGRQVRSKDYEESVDSESTETFRAQPHYTTECWEVGPHTRTYKNGVTRLIKPTTRHRNKKLLNKN